MKCGDKAEHFALKDIFKTAKFMDAWLKCNTQWMV